MIGQVDGHHTATALDWTGSDRGLWAYSDKGSRTVKTRRGNGGREAAIMCLHAGRDGRGEEEEEEEEVEEAGG